MGVLDGKVVLITGGASGIGRAVARRFAAEGARLCVLDLDADGLRSLQAECGDDRCVVVVGDVTRLADNEGAVAAAVEAFGRLDVFIGNAGVHDGFARLVDVPGPALEEAYERLFAINVKGCLLGARAAAPELRRVRGNMIFTASQAAFYPDGGGVLYTAAKHAVLGLIRQLAFELAPDVRVNGVAPGGTLTPIGPIQALKPFVRPRPGGMTREESIRHRNPLGIATEPEDHVAAYLLLASDAGKAMTGEVIRTDGGLAVRGCWQGKAPSGDA